MKVRWTGKAAADLARLHEFLRPVAPEAAARIVLRLTQAPDRLLEYPRLGKKIEAYEPREVRSLRVGDYELRYEIDGGTILIVRLFHCREGREL